MGANADLYTKDFHAWMRATATFDHGSLSRYVSVEG